MAAYKSIVYKEIIEIDGVQHTLLECDYTCSVDEAIEDGAISDPARCSKMLFESEVIEYVKCDYR
jgi:hypothetical protein